MGHVLSTRLEEDTTPTSMEGYLDDLLTGEAIVF